MPRTNKMLEISSITTTRMSTNYKKYRKNPFPPESKIFNVGKGSLSNDTQDECISICCDNKITDLCKAIETKDKVIENLKYDLKKTNAKLIKLLGKKLNGKVNKR